MRIEKFNWKVRKRKYVWKFLIFRVVTVMKLKSIFQIAQNQQMKLNRSWNVMEFHSTRMKIFCFFFIFSVWRERWAEKLSPTKIFIEKFWKRKKFPLKSCNVAYTIAQLGSISAEAVAMSALSLSSLLSFPLTFYSLSCSIKSSNFPLGRPLYKKISLAEFSASSSIQPHYMWIV